MKKAIDTIVFLRRLSNVPVWGGLEKIVEEWFERIDHTSCRVIFVVTSKEWKDLFQKHFDEKHLPVHIVQLSFALDEGAVKLFMDMYRFLRSLKPSKVIFVQGAFTDFRLPAVFAGFLASGNNAYMHENLGAPMPSDTYGLKKVVQRFFSICRAFFSKKVIVLSQGIKDQLTQFWGYPSSKVTVSYHGIDLEKWKLSSHKRQQIRQTMNIPASDFVFITYARLAKEKCIDRIIESFDRLAQEHGDLWLLIIGEGDLKKDLQDLAGFKKSKERIIFLGYKENVVDYLNAADCYVNSSDKEGLCIALLEAMACGVISTATDCAGPTEIIKNSQSGFLVEKSVEGVFSGMRSAVSLSAGEKEQMIRRGMSFVAENFDLDLLVKNTLNMMQVPIATGAGQ